MRKINKVIRIISATFFVLSSTGCAGDWIEHDPPDSGLVGKSFSFNTPVVYLLLSKEDEDDFDSEAVKIGRKIHHKFDAEDEYSIFNKFKKENVKDGMTFTVLASYWSRAGLIAREFAPDVHMLILEDENHVKSVCNRYIAQRFL